MEFRSNLMQEKEIRNALRRISFQIIEQNRGVEDLVRLGSAVVAYRWPNVSPGIFRLRKIFWFQWVPWTLPFTGMT